MGSAPTPQMPPSSVVVKFAAGAFSANIFPMRQARALIAIPVLALAAGCGTQKKLPLEPGDGVPDPNATFRRVQGEVLSISCALAGCHLGAGPQAGMNLALGAAYASIVGVASSERPELKRIQPGSPDRSYLVKKIRGDADISGSPMPLSGSITPQQRQLVIDWVLRGAPND